jgi:DNA-binding MarR family transcriptional regulator
MWARKSRWTRFPNELIERHFGLSLQEHAVLLALLAKCDWTGRPTKTVKTVKSASADVIAADLGISVASVRRAVASLVERKVVFADRPARRRPYVYTIYLTVIEALCDQFERSHSAHSVRAHSAHKRSLSAPTARTSALTQRALPRNSNELEDKEPNQPTGGVAIEFSDCFHPSANVYDVAQLTLSPEVEQKYGNAEALVVAGDEKFFVMRNGKGSSTRWLNGPSDWVMCNKHPGKCGDCGTHVAKGIGVFIEGQPRHAYHHDSDPLVLGVGDWEEWQLLWLSEEMVLGTAPPTPFDHVRFPHEQLTQ